MDVLIRFPEQAFQRIQLSIVEPVQGAAGETFEIDLLERRSTTLEDERASIEATLADVTVYDDAQRPRLRALLVRRGRLDVEIAEVESLWLEKSGQLDAMRGLATCASQGAE